ncbi:MAG: hypothetical protein ACYC9M_00490 [Desulfobulbaceae bacterium]
MVQAGAVPPAAPVIVTTVIVRPHLLLTKIFFPVSHEYAKRVHEPLATINRQQEKISAIILITGSGLLPIAK